MPIPGELFLRQEAIVLNAGRPTMVLTVENTGDRAVQIGSHYHFFEVNRALRFDRARAMGMRLAIPAGTSVRFEPGQVRDITLVTIGGTQRAVGFAGLTNGSTTARDSVLRARDRAARLGFAGATLPDPVSSFPAESDSTGGHHG